MAGNARSGRRAKPAAPIRGGRPTKPATLNTDEAYYWRPVIEVADHLEAIDSALCESAVRVFGLLQDACRKAKKNSTDGKAKSAVCAYGVLLDKLTARLAVDPLGRARQRVKPEVAHDDPLKEFDLK